MRPCIYSLSCPTTGEIKYIGRTTYPLGRLKDHIQLSGKTGHHNKLLYDWIKAIVDKNLQPVFNVLIECDFTELAKYEKHYFNLHKSSGLLFNIQEMGTQYSGFDIERLRQIVKIKRIKQKYIAKATGVPQSGVSALLRGNTSELSITKARLIEDYLLSI